MVIIPCWPKLAQVLPQNGLGIYLLGRMAVRIGGLNEEVLGRPRVLYIYIYNIGQIDGCPCCSSPHGITKVEVLVATYRILTTCRFGKLNYAWFLWVLCWAILVELR